MGIFAFSKPLAELSLRRRRGLNSLCHMDLSPFSFPFGKHTKKGGIFMHLVDATEEFLGYMKVERSAFGNTKVKYFMRQTMMLRNKQNKLL